MAGYSSVFMSPGTYSDTLGTYARSWAIQDSVPSDGSKLVTVSVAWPTNRGGEHVTLTTYISK